MPCWPISYRDGIYQVTDGDGILHPITLNRLPVEMFNAGWRATGLQTGLPTFHLLELRHDGPPQSDAVWYLNDELDFVANTLGHFDRTHAAAMVAGLSPLLHDIHDATLCAARPAVAASTHAFDGINPIFVNEMISFVVETALSAPDVVMAHRLDGLSADYAAEGTRLSTALLRHSLDVAVPEPAADGLRLASPFDAALLTMQEHFEIGTGSIRQVYRFRDPSAQVTLYLLFQQDGAPALYVPMMNTVFATRDGLSGAEVMTTLLAHYACHGDRTPGDRPEAEHALDAPEASAPPEADPAPVEAAALHEPAGTPGAQAAAVPDVAMHPKWWKRLFGLGHA